MIFASRRLRTHSSIQCVQRWSEIREGLRLRGLAVWRRTDAAPKKNAHRGLVRSAGRQDRRKLAKRRVNFLVDADADGFPFHFRLVAQQLGENLGDACPENR